MDHCFVVDFKGEAEPRPVVGVDVMRDLAIGAYYHMSRQTSPRDAGSISANAAQRRQLLHNKVAVVEIHIAGLGPSMLAHSRIGSIPGKKGIVVAQPVVQCKPWRDFPGILKEAAQQTARPFLLIHIATASAAVGNVEQKRCKWVARGGTQLGIVCLLSSKTHSNLGQRTGEIGGIESDAKLDFVASDDLRVGAAQFIRVGCLGGVVDALAPVCKSADAGTGKQRTSAIRGKSAHEPAGKTHCADDVRGRCGKENRLEVSDGCACKLRLPNPRGAENVNEASALVARVDGVVFR